MRVAQKVNAYAVHSRLQESFEIPSKSGSGQFVGTIYGGVNIHS